MLSAKEHKYLRPITFYALYKIPQEAKPNNSINTLE